MSRVLFNYLIPLLVPIAIYIGWIWISHRPANKDDFLVKLQDGPWFWAVILGAVLAIASMVMFGLGADQVGPVYTPPDFMKGGSGPVGGQ